MSNEVTIALIAAAPGALLAVANVIVAWITQRKMSEHDEWERRRSELNGERSPDDE